MRVLVPTEGADMWRLFPGLSLASQGDHGINPGRTASREPRGALCHQQQRGRHREVDERVRRIDLEERLLHQPRHRERARDAERDAGEREPAAMAEHHPHDHAGRRAERHANADLTRAERHEVRHHAVDAQAGEQ